MPPEGDSHRQRKGTERPPSLSCILAEIHRFCLLLTAFRVIYVHAKRQSTQSQGGKQHDKDGND
nr:MAG TPA: hypothetical protein [Caudoviricetes sp.]